MLQSSVIVTFTISRPLFSLQFRRRRWRDVVADGRCGGGRGQGAPRPAESRRRPPPPEARVIPLPLRLGVRRGAVAEVNVKELVHHERQRRRVRKYKRSGYLSRNRNT